MKKDRKKLTSFLIFMSLFLISYILVFAFINRKTSIETPNFNISENILIISNVLNATHFEIFKAPSTELNDKYMMNNDFNYFVTVRLDEGNFTYFPVTDPSHGTFFKLRAISKSDEFHPSGFTNPLMMRTYLSYLEAPVLIVNDNGLVSIESNGINVSYHEVLIEIGGGKDPLIMEVSIENPSFIIDLDVPQILSARSISNSERIMNSLSSEEVVIGNISRIEKPQFTRVDGQLFIDSVTHAGRIEVTIEVPNRNFGRIYLDPAHENVISLELVRSQTVTLRAISNHPIYVSSAPVSVNIRAFAVVYLFDYGNLYVNDTRVLSEEISGLYFEGSTTSVAVFEPGLRVNFNGFDSDYNAEYHYIEDIQEDHVITINASIIQLDLPIISLVNNLRADVDRNYWVSSSLTIIDEYGIIDNYYVQIRGQGNATWYRPLVPKLPYRFRFPLGNETSILGFAAARDFVLLANAADNSHLRAYLGHSISQAIAPPERFEATIKHVELFLNGEFQGIYTLTEQMQYHENRVNIDLEAGDWYLEMDGRAGNDGVIYGVDYIQGYFGRNTQLIDLTRTPNNSDRTPQQVDELRELLNNFNNSILRRDNSFHNYINMESFIDYFLVQELVMNMDIGWSSVHFTVKNGIIHMGPLWDIDHASLNTSWGWHNQVQPGPYVYQTMFVYQNHGWFRYLMRNSNFAKAFNDRWQEINETLLQDIFSIENQEYLIDFLLPSIYYEDLRWGTYWDDAWIRQYHHWSVTEARFIYSSDFETYVRNLFDFFRMRSDFLTIKIPTMALEDDTQSRLPLFIVIFVVATLGTISVKKVSKKKRKSKL